MTRTIRLVSQNPVAFSRHLGMDDKHDPHLDSMATERFTVRQLRKAFAMVQNPDNWKGVISAVVDPHFRDIVEDAIPFMTGSVAHFSDAEGGLLHVRAMGYYEAVGA